MKKYLLTIFPSLLMVGCLNSKDPNSVEQFTLRTAKSIYTFTIPAGYHTNYSNDAQIISMSILYPAMSPSSIRKDEENKIYMQISPLRLGDAQNYLNRLTENTKLVQHLGKQGAYDVYDTGYANYSDGHGNDSRLKRPTLTFFAKDGQLVLVEPVTTFEHYNIYRNISSDLGIMYSFKPKLGNDFIRVDEEVMRFVNSHLKFKSTLIQEKSK